VANPVYEIKEKKAGEEDPNCSTTWCRLAKTAKYLPMCCVRCDAFKKCGGKEEKGQSGFFEQRQRKERRELWASEWTGVAG
jgi:hypothetical protein